MRGAKQMSDKRLNNSIYLMFLISGAYCSAHGLSNAQFLELDRRHGILNYIGECPDVFDLMSEDEMVREVDAYVNGV